MPNFVSHIAPGFALRGQIRALELTLALSEKASVSLRLPRPEAVSALNALLESKEIERVHALSAQPPAPDAIHLQFQPGDCVAPLPETGVWLVVTEKARSLQPRDLLHYERCLAFAAPGATDATAVEVLPYAVRALPGQAAASGDGVLLIGQGDSAQDRQRAEELVAQGASKVVLFDPYRRVTHVAWPPQVTWHGACPKAARLAAFATCGSVGLSDPIGTAADDHFYCEARQAGLRALDPAIDGLEQPAVPWGRAVQAFISPSTRPPLPPRTYKLAQHRVVHYADWAQIEAPKSDAAAVLCPGPEARFTPGLWQALANYKTIYLDATENPDFFTQLFAGLPQLASKPGAGAPPKVNNFTGLMPLLNQLLASPSPALLHVVHVAGVRSRLQEYRDMLDGLLARSGQGLTGQVPTLVVNTRKLFRQGGMSPGRMGVDVAHDQLRSGMVQAARGRFNVLWCSRHGLTAQRQRIYYYPLAGPVGLDGDELDPPVLQQMLAENKVDAMCAMDAFLWFTLSARALWARRTVPVTAMLHSMHSSTMSTEVLMQLLSGPTLACDRIISPSRVGAAAFAHLQEAVSAHLAPLCKEPPRFNGKIEVIPYGVEPAYYRGHDRRGCRQALGLALDRPTILSLARFSQREKVDLLPLLLSVRELRRKHPEVQLLLAGGKGDDRYAEHVQEMVGLLELEDAVRLFLDVSAEDKLLLYGACDIFTSISDNVQETYGLTLLEAMACGVPVVASAWDGHRETVREGETGLLVPTYWTQMPPHLEAVLRVAEGWAGYGQRDLHESVVVDPAALTRSFDHLLSNPDARRRMGARAQEICARDYDERTQSRRINELLSHQIEEAAKIAWTPPQVLRPFVDAVSQRFAHYPADRLSDDAPLRAAPALSDKGWQKTLLTAAGITTRQEANAVDAIVKAAAKTASIRMGDLVAAVTGADLTHDQARLRVLRCLKYGLLEKI